MEKEMIEHFQYLKDKGLNDIEFYEGLVKCTRPIFFNGLSLIQKEKDDKGTTQNINVSLLKDSQGKVMYHGTSLEIASTIISDGFIKMSENVGLLGRSTDEDAIEYNKIFITNEMDLARQYGLKRCGSNNNHVVITIDITKYKVYTFVPGEWFIWGKINIKDVKFNYFVENVPMGELSPEGIIDLTPRADIFSKVLELTNKYLFDIDPFGIHGIYHSRRVILILQQLVKYEISSYSERVILAYAGLYHDIGRTTEGTDKEHGFISYKKIIKYGLLDNVDLSNEEFEIMRFIIEYHCIDDNIGHKALKEYNIKEYGLAWKLYNIFKDADGLDRVRLGDFNRKYLRKTYSQTAERYAQSLYELDAQAKVMINRWIY